VRYDEFRGQLEAALERNSLHFHGLQRVETIELANTLRHWKACDLGAAPPSTEPFHVSAEIGFAWSPFDAARSYAREEDLLTELIGRKKRLPRTERRWTRVDLWLRARLPYGSTMAMPVYGELLFDQAKRHATLLHPFLYVIDFKRALNFGEAQPPCVTSFTPQQRVQSISEHLGPGSIQKIEESETRQVLASRPI
jgi:hypothetical protein